MRDITSKGFKRATGREAEDDDLERTNCEKQGEFGHYSCGWCRGHLKPRFVCGCILIKEETCHEQTE